MNKKIYIRLAGLAVFASIVMPVFAIKGGAQDYLTVRGNQILLNGQRPLMLQGIATGDPYFREISEKRNVSDYAVIKNWQANVVRLSVHPGVFIKDEGALKKELKKEILAARNTGLFVIVDWHVIGLPDKSSKDWPQGRYNGVLYSSDFETAKNFWQYMAAEYGNDRGIIFEIWNEAYDYKGQSASWADIKPYMQGLYDCIRAKGADNIVLSPGVLWGYDLRGVKKSPLAGRNIGYTWHNYPDSSKCLSWDQALDGLNEQYPIFLSEWGFSTETVGQHFSITGANNTYPEKIKNFIVDKNLNSVAWIWSANSDPKMLTSNWHDLTAFGRFVNAFLVNVSQGNLVARINSTIDWSGYSSVPELKQSCEAYRNAFGQVAISEGEMADVRRIDSGQFPLSKDSRSEEKARTAFAKLYKRQPSSSNPYDKKAIMMIAYGVKPKKNEINLAKEKSASAVFAGEFGHKPSNAQERNIFRAIAYSGAKK